MGNILWEIPFSKNSSFPVGILLKSSQTVDLETSLHEIGYYRPCLNTAPSSYIVKNNSRHVTKEICVLIPELNIFIEFTWP